MKEEVKRIKEKLSELNLHPIYLEHEEVITSEDAVRTRGFELKQGIKSILLTKGIEYLIVNIPADRKIDLKKVASLIGWSKNKTRIATEEEVIKNTGCEIGAVPPFGHKEKIQILVDKKIYDNDISTFNIGLRAVSLKIPTEEMKIVFSHVNAIEGDFVKD